MKISLITACYNSAGTIRTAIESVLSQKDVEIEYIVVDGGSTDGTVSLLHEYEAKMGNPPSLKLWRTSGERGAGNGKDSTRFTFKWISEPDQGMYDAINKGIKCPFPFWENRSDLFSQNVPSPSLRMKT